MKFVGHSGCDGKEKNPTSLLGIKLHLLIENYLILNSGSELLPL